MWWEIFINNPHEFTSNVGLAALAVWRVEPDDVPFSVSCFLVWLTILQIAGVSTGFQSFLVQWTGLVELVLITGKLGESFLDHIRKLLDN